MCPLVLLELAWKGPMSCTVIRGASLTSILYAVALHAEYAVYVHPCVLPAPVPRERALQATLQGGSCTEARHSQLHM